jgi:hypothetical protein
MHRIVLRQVLRLAFLAPTLPSGVAFPDEILDRLI